MVGSGPWVPRVTKDGRFKVTCAPDRRPRLEQSSIRSNLQRSQAKRSQTPKLGVFPVYRLEHRYRFKFLVCVQRGIRLPTRGDGYRCVFEREAIIPNYSCLLLLEPFRKEK